MALLVPLLWKVTLAGIVAAAVLGGFRRGSERGRRQAVALAIGLGYVVGHVAQVWPAWPPSEVTDRIPFLVLAAMLLGLLEANWPAPAWAAWENRLLVALVTVVAIVGPAVQETWETRQGETTLRLAALALGIALAWGSLEGLAARATGAGPLLSLFLVAAGATGVIVLSGYSMVLVGLAAALAATLAAAALTTARVPGPSLARGGIPVVVVALASLLLDAHHYASAPGSSALVLGAATAAPWVVRLGPLRRLAAGKATLVSLAATLVPVGIALALAFAARPEPEY